MSSNDAPMSQIVCPPLPARAASLISMRLNFCPAAKNVTITPSSRPMSPVRVVRNALRAAFVFGFSSHQCPMSMKEHRPTSSQPERSMRELFAMTSTSIDAVNSESAA